MAKRRALRPAWFGVFPSVDGRDVGVVELREQLRLALEPCQPLDILRQMLWQNLDRDITFEPSVTRPVHLAHASRAQRREDLVVAESSSGVHGPEGYVVWPPGHNRTCVMRKKRTNRTELLEGTPDVLILRVLSRETIPPVPAPIMCP